MLNTASNNTGYPLRGGGLLLYKYVWVGCGWRFGSALQHPKLYVCKGATICCY